MKKLITVIFASFLLFACSKRDENVIRIGTISGPETELMVEAKRVAKNNYGVDVEIVEFTDYAIPNAALDDGSIDMNAFQHQPYLDETIAARGYKLTTIGKTFIYPMGLYSHKLKSLEDLPQGAQIAVPNDPTNEARALLLLQQAGLIALNPDAGYKVTEQDITDNPLKLNIKAIEAAQLPRVLDDVDLAAINTNYAMPAKLIPKEHALLIEGPDSLYANIVVVRSEDKDDPQLHNVLKAINSVAVVKKAQHLFQDQAIPAFEAHDHGTGQGDSTD